MELTALCSLAFLAGFIDSIAGGGGLIQLPALFIFLPPNLAASVPSVLGTNKLASVCGTSLAAVQYSRHVQINWKSILPAGLAALVFSFLGARAVSLLDSHILKPAILILLIAVAVYTFIRKDFGKLHAPRLSPGQERLLAVVVGICIGFYDGFFGPGTGSFLVFIFIGLFGFSFLNASASAKVINVATNLSAVAFFIVKGNIYYRYALPMGLCNILGSMTGSRVAILKGNYFVRNLFLIVVSIMILRFGWEIVKGH